ncbi:MAG TPA: cob(I)yrinic acid a,c-diamide adenosyltransferase, partial [Deltaproteobacteria bacterium]|nr:cob(I)yrinic acid a,c-diamide adenosyltransferase [Deltaproteobacteria bacterium]
DPEDVERARSALQRLHEIMEARSCNILIADEMITAGMFNLISQDDIIGLIESKPSGMELVLTGRGATDRVITAADLVTEMKEIKHYYTEGVQARKGIES